MGLTVYGGGGKPEEEKTVTAGTSVMEVLPSSGKTMKKVNVNPTPTEEKTITAGTSATMVTPTSGKYIKKVTVNPTPSQSKTVTPSTSQQTVSPDSGKLLSQVIVKAMEDVTPEVTAQIPVITQIAENLGVTITTPSGTNKQILQGNNANLLNIKNNAKKEGLYVWKKYECISVENPSFLLTKKSGSASYQISDASFDFSAISEDKYAEFFDGFSGENSSFANSSGAVEITAKWSDGYTYSKVYSYEDFDSSTGTFNNASSASQTFSEMVYFTGTKQTGAKTFVDYVVSDSETAYPDGAVHTDGYWYEKVKLAPDNGISFYDIRPSTDSNYPYAPQTMKIKMDNIPERFMHSGSLSSYAPDTNLGGLLTRAEIDSGIIGNRAFYVFFKGLGKTAKAKVILNCESIGEYCFNSIGASPSYSVSIYITSKCTEILTGSSAGRAPFFGADRDNVKLYLEASSAPSGFETYWNNYSNGSTNTLSTMYGVTREAFEAL